MIYLLDTSVCIYLKRNRPAHVTERFAELSPGEVGISSVTLAELEYGVSKSRHHDRDRAILDELLQLLVVAPFDRAAASHYGEIRAALERAGTPIGPFDTQIAAHARSLELTLVTHDTSEFTRVPGLKVEDWH